MNFDASKTLMSNHRKLQKHRDGYVEWITRVLNSHKAPTIDELTVRCDLTRRWIEMAALMKKVKRLELDFKPCLLIPGWEYYRFGLGLCGSSEIKFLTCLCFKHVEVSGQVLESVLSNCPLLETLHVSHSIIGWPKLPNLRYLTCEVRDFQKEKERRGLLSLLRLVESSPLFPKFKVELGIRIAYGLEKGEIEEVVEGVETMIQNTKRSKMESLREVEIVGFFGEEADTALLIYLAKTALNLDNIAIDTCPPHWNQPGVDMLWINEPGRARRPAYDLLLEHRPKGADIHEYNDNMNDRISQLPQELLARIFSSLSFEEVVRTSVLSRTWRDLWKFTTVTLNFDASKTLMSSRRKLQKHMEGYVEWITRVLNSHKAPTVDELRVGCDLTDRYTHDINRWIEVALMKKVKKLELDFKPGSSIHSRDNGCYRFERRFCASSEIKLLTSLCFKHVNVCGQVLESVLSNCPLLETLHVSHSPSVQLTKLDVSGSSLRLKHLHISFCKHLKRIEVYAPNLVSFEHSSREAEHLVLRYVPQLRDVSYGVPWMCYIGVDGLQAFPGCLSTCASQLVNLSLQFLFEIETLGCPQFPNLRYLTCEVRSFLKAKETVGLLNLFQLIDSSPLLHKLKVELEMDYAHRWKKGGGEIEKAIQVAETMVRYRRGHKTRSLREVEIVGFSGADAETTLLIYLAKTALNLDSIAINTCPSHWNRAAKAGIYLNKPGKARRFDYDLLLKHLPEGAHIHLL
ncbi:hypothetical protein V6N12_015011 [Hibiscus sabdariffa]|uniref:F-box domain-containing protein n=1 Tax=Hibiscus sabdariffa TaxID=183260 RepID=A0ABR2DLV9_9ROSI